MIITLSSALSYDGLAINGTQESAIEKTSDQTDGEQDPPVEVYKLQIDKTYSPTLQIDFHADLNFEFEFPELRDNSTNLNRLDEKESKEYFKTLFHFIISPNAP